MQDQVIIFDTTLRDGEQSPGASMNAAEKLRLARQLQKLGVDVIEAGFPAASSGDFDAVKMIAKKIRGVQVAALARASKEDVDRAWGAIKEGAHPRIHTFISSSDIHQGIIWDTDGTQTLVLWIKLETDEAISFEISKE